MLAMLTALCNFSPKGGLSSKPAIATGTSVANDVGLHDSSIEWHP